MKKTNKVILVIRIISLIIIIYCVVYIVLWYLDNKQNAGILEQLTDESIVDTIIIELPKENNDQVNASNEEEKTQITTYVLDFKNLLSKNNTTVGWINVPNTSINYPVVHANDNSFYLNHSFDKSKNSAGWIFADYRNKFDGTDKNIIIYGHNRVDTSMFATLKNTQKSNWYNNPSNRYITFTTPNETIIYEVFSVYTIKSETYYLQTQFSNDKSYTDFLNTLKSRSIHDFGVNLNKDDSIITLSTCDATGKGRVILHARKKVLDSLQ